MTKKIISIISGARTGSTYISDILGNFKNINNNAELFNPCNMLAWNVQVKYRKDLDNDYLQSIKQTTPHIILNSLLEIIEEDILSYKVHDKHLLDSHIEGIIERSTLVIFLYRNHIDKYISLQKAQKLNTWQHTDTSFTKIVLNKQDMINHKNEMKVWYSNTKALVKEKHIVFFEIDYDKFFELSFIDQLEYLKNNIEAAINVHLSLNENPKVEFKKQDKTTCYSDKLENYVESKEFIETENWQIVFDNIKTCSQLKVKEHESISSRSIFKYKDIIDYWKKNNIV